METIKSYILTNVESVLMATTKENKIVLPFDFSLNIEYPNNAEHGHYSISSCLNLAKIFKQSPKSIANNVCHKLNTNTYTKDQNFNTQFTRIEVVDPGFINFFTSSTLLITYLKQSLNMRTLIPIVKNSSKIILEFVSANPTGPLNIVSTRAAVVGDIISRVLKELGYKVHTEYYVNNHGKQVYWLGISLAIHYLNKNNMEIELLDNCYQGDYLKDVLDTILNNNNELSKKMQTLIKKSYSKEHLLTEIEPIATLLQPYAIETLLASQKKDLQDLNITFDQFFVESQIHQGDLIATILDKLSDYTYNKDGALYFKSTMFHDDKDRVLKRSTGEPTYFLADIAYHYHKFQRGFSLMYNIWGPDHHGYILRLQSALNILTKKDCLNILIIQQVNLYENNEKIVMSKRLGQFKTMRDLLDKIPQDVIRYFFANRSQSQHLDFDLDLALNETNKNPVYYIQYAHARIHSIFKEVQIPISKVFNLKYDTFLEKANRSTLILSCLQFIEKLELIGKNLEIHHLTNELNSIANKFTSFYHHEDNQIKKIIQEDTNEANILLQICQFTANTLALGLSLMGISQPTKM